MITIYTIGFTFSISSTLISLKSQNIKINQINKFKYTYSFKFY